MVGVDEVAVVRQPAEGEYGYHNDEHPHYLDCRINLINID